MASEITEPATSSTGLPPQLTTTPQVSSSPEKPAVKSTPRTTLKVGDLLKVEPKKEKVATVTATKAEVTTAFTTEQFHVVWMEFAEQRKKYQAEYQLLMQPYDLQGSRVVVRLHSPVQDTLLNNVKADLTTILREKLKNDSILIVGELNEADDKKMMYTSRDKFEYLQEKNPNLRELKERLGLDPDF